MAIQRIPIATSLDPEEFGSGVVTKGPTAVNMLWSHYSDGRVYASQRPAIEVIGLASVRSLAAKGRGIIYWDKVAGEANNGIYFVNDNIVYAGSYDNPLPQQITAGRDPVHLVESANFLAIIDAENNQAWYISASSPEQLFKITDTAFPGVTNNAKLAGGGAELDGFLFVLDTDGRLYNSNLNDVTEWQALDFIDAQREQDAGVFLTKHADHLCVLGSNSIEFFYNAGNQTGSPVQRRPDVSYRTGALDRRNVFTSGERVYFIGSEKIGTPGIYEISGFQLNKVSPDSIDRFLAKTRSVDGFKFNITGGFIGEHYLTLINTLEENDTTGGYDPAFTFFYDATNKVWGEFKTDISTVTAFAMAGISERSAILRGESVIMFMSGDLAVFNMSGSTLDISGEDQYIVDGYIEAQPAWVEGGITENQVNIYTSLIFNENDFGSLTTKFMYRFAVVGTTIGAEADASAPMRISWSDDTYKTFTSPRMFDLGRRRSITRLGSFKRRAFKLEYSGNDRLRLEELEFDVAGSSYA